MTLDKVFFSFFNSHLRIFSLILEREGGGERERNWEGAKEGWRNQFEREHRSGASPMQ